MHPSTPLTSEYPADTKGPADLPIYRIDDSNEELVVGQRRACFWRRHCARACEEGGQKTKRSCARRVVRWFFTILLTLGLVGFFMGWAKVHREMKMHPVVCVPLEGTTYSLELPLANLRTHIGLDVSLTGGDVSITHSSEVKNGTAAFSFELPSDVKFMDGEETPGLYACHIAGPRMVGLGVHTKDKHTRAPKAKKVTITLSSDEAGHSRGIFLRGDQGRFGHGCGAKMLRKAVRKSIKKSIKKSIDEAAAAASWEKIDLVDVE